MGFKKQMIYYIKLRYDKENEGYYTNPNLR